MYTGYSYTCNNFISTIAIIYAMVIKHYTVSGVTDFLYLDGYSTVLQVLVTFLQGFSRVLLFALNQH